MGTLPLRLGVVYDFRNPPDSGIETPRLYADILEQVAWLDALGLGAGLPHAQEPDPVEAHPRQAVELGVGNIVQGRGPTQGAGQLRQPDPGIDLVERGIAYAVHVRIPPLFISLRCEFVGTTTPCRIAT